MAKTAIITGGSRGLGAAMTRRLGKMGYNIVLNYHSDSSEKLAADIVAELSELLLDFYNEFCFIHVFVFLLFMLD